MEKKHLFSLRSLPIGKILLLFLLIYIALLAIPYIQHKNVSVSYQKKFAKQSFYSDTAGTERVAYINDNTPYCTDYICLTRQKTKSSSLLLILMRTNQGRI